MFSAMLFLISIVALSQFALYYWRAVLAGVAAQPGWLRPRLKMGSSRRSTSGLWPAFTI